MTTPIPQPPRIPFLGNTRTIDQEMPIQSYLLLAKQYGEIYQLDFLGTTTIHCNTFALQNELSDDTRFKKFVAGPLAEVRRVTGNGLFTAQLDDPDWAIAHRILMPVFGPASVAGMYEGMMDVCSQMLLKWERFGPSRVFDASDDMAKATFDALSLCMMGYRLNLFYMEGTLPFEQSMSDFLAECFARVKRPRIVGAFMSETNTKWEADAEVMLELTRKILQERKSSGLRCKDILDQLIYGRDPKTGQGLSDENIVYQLVTFMIAGHETTTGVLCFVVHCLLTNPEAMVKLRSEIDTVLGDRVITMDDIDNLPYLTAVIRETMRLFPPAPRRSVTPIKDTTLGNGRYFVKAGATCTTMTIAVHRDPMIWGEDAEKFRPDRMLDGKFEALPPNAWQPFGFGLRACIGRQFAWQELHLFIASFIQRFDLQLNNPASYALRLKFALTIKPVCEIRVTHRKSRFALVPTSSTRLLPNGPDADIGSVAIEKHEGKKPIYVLYGSNTGTCESLAQKIATGASAYGFSAKTGSLDSAVGTLPTDGPVIILTASYEGEPADNAGRFVSWLKQLEGNKLENVQYCVFGAGNHDWVNTYQKIPKLCDDLLSELGCQRILERGEGDAGSAKFFASFDTWAGHLWAALSHLFDIQKAEVIGLQMKVVEPVIGRAANLRQGDLDLALVLDNRDLTLRGPTKLHLEFELPDGMTYRSGNYLAILPTNPVSSVHRVLVRFGLSGEQEIILTAGDVSTSLPVGKPLSISSLLSGYVELSQPASLDDLRSLIKYTTSDDSRSALNHLVDSHAEQVMSVRLSILDILERHRDLNISFPAFLQMLPPMRIRQYSISSSPLWDPRRVTLTVSVIRAPALADQAKQFEGVASSFLAGLRKGDRIAVCVRPSNAAFHLPEDPLTPIVMFCAGSGIAPMRAFMQERSVQKQSGRPVGKMLLFYGCRSPEMDLLYHNTDLKEWIDTGIVEVFVAFSQQVSAAQGCKYVQDRILLEHAVVADAYTNGAKFYICGSSKVSVGIKDALTTIIEQKSAVSHNEAVERLGTIMKERFATDVFE